MGTFQASESIVVDASAATVYAILADYEVGHDAILPKQYFKQMTILEGGQGPAPNCALR